MKRSRMPRWAKDVNPLVLLDGIRWRGHLNDVAEAVVDGVTVEIERISCGYGHPYLIARPEGSDMEYALVEAAQPEEDDDWNGVECMYWVWRSKAPGQAASDGWSGGMMHVADTLAGAIDLVATGTRSTLPQSGRRRRRPTWRPTSMDL